MPRPYWLSHSLIKILRYFHKCWTCKFAYTAESSSEPTEKFEKPNICLFNYQKKCLDTRKLADQMEAEFTWNTMHKPVENKLGDTKTQTFFFFPSFLPFYLLFILLFILILITTCLTSRDIIFIIHLYILTVHQNFLNVKTRAKFQHICLTFKKLNHISKASRVALILSILLSESKIVS